MSPCTTNPELWFSETPEEIESAKDACLDCPLSRFNACRSEGWKHEHGVFGGMSADDRRETDPKRFAALVASNDAVALAIDQKLRPELFGNGVKTATETPRTALIARAIALTVQGLSSRQVGDILDVQAPTIRWWVRRYGQLTVHQTV